MSSEKIDASEIARMVAQREAELLAQQEASLSRRHAAVNRPVRANDSRFRFGLTCTEDDEGTTLLLRAYRSRVAFSEERNPIPLFIQDPRRLAMVLVSGAIAFAMGTALKSLSAWAVLALAWIAVLVLVRRSCVLHVRVTRLGHFVIYERSPRRPIGLGPKGKLKMDFIEDRSGGQRHRLRCQWIAAEGAKWVRNESFALDPVREADKRTAEQFFSLTGIQPL